MAEYELIKELEMHRNKDKQVRKNFTFTLEKKSGREYKRNSA